MMDLEEVYITEAAKDLIGSLWHEARIERLYALAQIALDNYALGKALEGGHEGLLSWADRAEQQALEGNSEGLRADAGCICGRCSPQKPAAGSEYL
jgi:hypothetical protein